ncbi:MAG: carbohydrate binding family 9 domain-containing protein [Chlorobi bacterium]|nr:carbohydrate binding family 9 domain-containing protein [Chlorobiota bacterium]
MKIRLFTFVVFFNFIYFKPEVSAQHSFPDTIRAVPLTEKIIFDGKLTESFWSELPFVSNFTQQELDFGKPVSEKTEVAVVYTKDALYFGIRCYQDPKTLIAKSMGVDADLRVEDNFKIVISPFNDNRGGYFFAVNPNGARTDILIAGNEDGNLDWNGVWDARTSVTSEGWFAEIYIPFATMQFKSDGNYNWAINFERGIASENEVALWQGWSRDNTIFSVVNAGTITGLKDISYTKKFEFKPYFLSGAQYNRDFVNDYPLKAGGDLNINITPSLKLNLTSYTDFAQVESDRIPVNLSRFSVYYPEKRAFFLEGYSKFDFYLGDRNTVFYTRTLGTENDQTVSVIGAVRLFGKIGKNNIGFLNLEEEKVDDISATNNTVFRYKYDIGEQSYIGGIFTNKINNVVSNQVLGIDASYQTSHFIKDKNLNVSASIAASGEDFGLSDSAFTYRIFADYPNDLIDNYMAVATMQKNFNPELGYMRRTNYRSYSWYFRITPRVFTKYGVKKILLKPWGFTVYQTLTTGELESLWNETRLLGAVFKSGERFEVNFKQSYDRLDENFDLTEDISIPEGKYWMFKNELQFETNRARRIWTGLFYNWGDFYTGKIKTFESEAGFNINKHFNFSASYTFNKVSLPEGDVSTHELASYINYAFNTRLNISFFGQWNSLEDIMMYNFRLHWIPQIGSDIYLVFNADYDEPVKQIEILKPESSAGIFKIVWRFTF